VHHITNPATEENLFTCEFAGEKEVNIAVSAALEAQKLWMVKSDLERMPILKKAADFLGERDDQLALMECINTGRPIQKLWLLLLSY
jgi:betaine-aldehyde dehydrogenase